MSIIIQSHGGPVQKKTVTVRAAAPGGGDIAPDEAADFGYFMPPSNNTDDYLEESGEIVGQLDELGDLMVDAPIAGEAGASSDSTMAPVLTYWGQFLDHELTARTDREGSITSAFEPHPPARQNVIEANLKNARSPRFDLDSVYGGTPLGDDMPPEAVKVANALRHPTLTNKMRVGTAEAGTELPDNLDPHRDLPRFGQVDQATRDAMTALTHGALTGDQLNKKALIGDMRNDENLIVAQFHLSFLRFHNKAVDFLEGHNTGWAADYHNAHKLTCLHYQWLAVNGYLKGVCDNAVVDRILADRAKHFFKFRADFDERNHGKRLGNPLPLEFSAAAFRFGHSMVRAAYDYNKIFGRPGGEASFELIFSFTGGGGFFGSSKLPRNWIIDWSRFVGSDPLDGSDGSPGRFARKIDTEIAPPLGSMVNEGNDEPDINVQALIKQLARRNLRRGYNMKLPTGQALHAHLKSIGAVTSDPITDVSTLANIRPAMKDFLTGSSAGFDKRTPLWFYILAEAESGGGNKLGEVGSFLVASTMIGVMLSDPDSAISKGFKPEQSPLKMADGSAIDTIAKWMKFAAVMA